MTVDLNFGGEGGNQQPQGSDSFQEKPEEKSYYDHVMENKKYADNEALAKGLYEGEKHIRTVESEAKGMREWIDDFKPFVPVVKAILKDPEARKKYGINLQQGTINAPGANQGAKPPDKTQPAGTTAQAPNPDAVKEVVESVMGSKLKDINQRLTQQEVNNVLEAMRKDKKTFPYMTREVEDEMGKILEQAGGSFPLNIQGLTILYEASVGRGLPQILEDHKQKVTEENMISFKRKSGNFAMTNEGNAGVSDEEANETRSRIKKAAARNIF